MPYSKQALQKELMDEIKAPEEVERPKSYQDNMYLDEIKANDIAMVEVAVQKECKHYKFPYNKTGAAQVNKFIGIAIDKALRKCGVNVIPMEAIRRGDKQAFLDLNHKTIEELFQKNRIKIESRPYGGEDQWRSGTYIYKDDVLAYFVSLPGEFKPSALAIDQRKWLVVKTNVPM